MIMPTKIIKPVDSLLCIGSRILRIVRTNNENNIDRVFHELNNSYPVVVSYEKYLLSLNFLYLIDKLEVSDETLEIRV